MSEQFYQLKTRVHQIDSQNRPEPKLVTLFLNLPFFRFLADIMDSPDLIRNVTLCGHLHHGKVVIHLVKVLWHKTNPRGDGQSYPFWTSSENQWQTLGGSCVTWVFLRWSNWACHRPDKEKSVTFVVPQPCRLLSWTVWWSGRTQS